MNYIIQLLITMGLLQLSHIDNIKAADFSRLRQQPVVTSEEGFARSRPLTEPTRHADDRLEFHSFGWEDVPPEIKPEEVESIMDTLLPELPHVSAYIASVNPSVDADKVAAVICMSAAEQGLDPWLLVAIARYESTFRLDAIGGAGELSLLQVHPCHEPKFAAAGCKWGDPFDCTRFGAMMLGTSLKKGWSLHKALSPWAVRPKALKLYATMDRATGDGLAREGGTLSNDGETERQD